VISNNKISLYGYNNITKNLSFSFYKIHYLHNNSIKKQYNQYVNKTYSAENLNKTLNHVCQEIGGCVLNVAMQNYQPQGASVTLMISEEAQPKAIIAHLDKSHLCVHTYPDDQPQNNIALFRADVELSTCGVISPLKVLNYLIDIFNPDFIDIDYRVRGMTRDKNGNKHFIDHDIKQICDFLNTNTHQKYRIKNNNLPIKNLFHSKLYRTDIDLENILFNLKNSELSLQQQTVILTQVQAEINDLFNS